MLMRTDVRDDGSSYILDIEMPGINKDEKDKEGKVLRQERYSGSCKRSFYVGDQLKQEDVKAAFENGVLQLRFPKETPKAVEEAPGYIQIEG